MSCHTEIDINIKERKSGLDICKCKQRLKKKTTPKSHSFRVYWSETCLTLASVVEMNIGIFTVLSHGIKSVAGHPYRSGIAQTLFSL